MTGAPVIFYDIIKLKQYGKIDLKRKGDKYMAAELKARKDMDKRYMWDLTQIYKTNEDWEKAFDYATGKYGDFKVAFTF